MAHGPLTSWKDGAAKQAILEFIVATTSPTSPTFVRVDDRIAVFDNDGTMWCEKPLPVHADLLLRQLGAMAEADPSLRSRQPWRAVAEKDYAWLGAAITKHHRGDDGDLDVIAAGLMQSHARISVDELAVTATEFLRIARHPTLDRPYLQCMYRPMLELIRFLGANHFSIYLASGGGRDFVRAVAHDIYGISPDHVIGSSNELAYQDGDVATIVRKPVLGLFDDGPETPVQIWARVGRRPIFAAGNSNGDIPMLRYCAHPSRPSLCLLIDHDDDRREFAYRDGAEDALRAARGQRWIVVSIQNDWNEVMSSGGNGHETKRVSS